MFNLYLVMFTLYVLLLLFMFLSLFLCAHIVMIFFFIHENLPHSACDACFLYYFFTVFILYSVNS